MKCGWSFASGVTISKPVSSRRGAGYRDALRTSPTIEYFPTPAHEDEYYDGLAEADLGRPDRLRAFYLERLVAAFEDT